MQRKFWTFQSYWKWYSFAFAAAAASLAVTTTMTSMASATDMVKWYGDDASADSTSPVPLEYYQRSQIERIPLVPNATESHQHHRDVTQQHYGRNRCPNAKKYHHHRRHNGTAAAAALHHHKNRNRNRNRRNGGRRDASKGRGKRHDSPNVDSDRLESIKQQILTKLGLSRTPNVTSQRSTKFLLEALSLDTRLFNEGVEDTTQAKANLEYSEPDDFYGRTSEIIGFAEPGYTLNGQKLLEFSWSQDMSAGDSNVKSAALWVRLEFKPDVPYSIRKSPPNLNFTFWVFQVTTGGLLNATYLSGKEFEEHSKLSASLPVRLSSLGWKTFDVTATIKEWYSAPKKDKLRLLVDCSGCSDLVTPVLFQDSRQASEWEKPFLMIHTDPMPTKRVRRRAIDCSLAKRDQCCKQQFYIRFKDIGWHTWIIAPSGYYANYCRGDCGGFHRTPDSYMNPHSFAMEDYKKINQYSLFEPCCAPVKFSPMSLIYVTPDNNIIKRDLPKMIVEECGCP